VTVVVLSVTSAWVPENLYPKVPVWELVRRLAWRRRTISSGDDHPPGPTDAVVGNPSVVVEAATDGQVVVQVEAGGEGGEWRGADDVDVAR